MLDCVVVSRTNPVLRTQCIVCSVRLMRRYPCYHIHAISSDKKDVCMSCWRSLIMASHAFYVCPFGLARVVRRASDHSYIFLGWSRDHCFDVEELPVGVRVYISCPRIRLKASSLFKALLAGGSPKYSIPKPRIEHRSTLLEGSK